MINVKTTSSDVGCNEQLGNTRTETTHDAVTLFLIHATVQRFGAVTATIERFGELINFATSTTENNGCFWCLDVKDATKSRSLMVTRNHVRRLLHQWRSAGFGC